VDAEEAVIFDRMTKPQQPEVREHAAKSAFERQSSYDRLAKTFFPEGPCHTKVADLPEGTLDAAWEFFGQLEKRAEMATSMAAKSVNRNKVGYKKRDFRPMLYAIICATRCFYIITTFIRGFHSAYIKSLAMFVQFLKVKTRFIMILITMNLTYIYWNQDLNPERSVLELLETALKEPVHKEEPSVIKFLVYVHAFHPEFKDMDMFQV
jgi:hypothetical protein